MKRAFVAGGFFGIGLIATWAALWIGSRMTFRFEFARHIPHLNGCYELDRCRAPWWATALFIFYILSPSLIYAFVGWRSGHVSSTLHQIVAKLIVMTTLTFTLYIASCALGW